MTTPWVIVDPNHARNSSGQLCSNGDFVYSVDDVAGQGATITPDSTNRPQVIVMGGRKRFYFPTGVTAFFTVTLPAGRQFNAISHCIGFEPPSVTVNNTLYGLFASTTTTNGELIRLVCCSSAGNGSTGGVMVVNDGAPRNLAKYGSGVYTYGLYGSVHCCNIMTIRYAPGPDVAAYINGTNTEITVAGGTATGNLTAFYLGKDNTTSSHFAGGYVDFWYIYDTALSQSDASDAYNSAVQAFPFFVNVDWSEPIVLFLGDSITHGFYTETDSTWHRKMFATDQATNFPDGQPQYLVLGHPGGGFDTMDQPVWDALLKPNIPAKPARLILHVRGANNAIRNSNKTAQQCYAYCKSLFDDFITAFPMGIFVTDSSSPRPASNTQLAEYDTLMAPEFPTLYTAPHIYSGSASGDFPNAYFAYIRLNANIGGPGNDATGTKADWTNTAPDGVTPSNVHWFYYADAQHHSGTDQAHSGQIEFVQEMLPLYQELLAPRNNSAQRE